jgi:HSP20 family protein
MIVTRIRPLQRPWWSAWGDFDRVRHDMARLAEAMSNGAFPEAGTRMFPLVNVTQDSDNFYVRAELPGVRANELEVSAVGSKLCISGSRALPEEEGGVSYHRREREGGNFSRSIELPSPFDRDRVEAQYENGLLTVTLPLAAETKPRQIPVSTG